MQAADSDVLLAHRRVGRIPIRNVWLLMLYASDLIRTVGDHNARLEEDPEDLPDLVANLLADAVTRRLRRTLTSGYHHRATSLTRVRGRIDLLTTEARRLLLKGEVFCSFEELTLDIPRNRLVRSALEMLGRARLIRRTELKDRCRALAAELGRAGVSGMRPSRAALAVDRIGRNDAADRFMVALARLAWDLALPTEDVGQTPIAAPDREERWVRRLFEKAVLGFARVELEPLGWQIYGGRRLEWQISEASAGIDTILPGMVTDIILDPPDPGRRVVIDTKFAAILGSGRFQEPTLKSGYIYQIYSYLRSQEGGCDPRWTAAAGLLLHPAVGISLDERVTIQQHPIRFATVDLAGSASAIRDELRERLGIPRSAG